MIDGVPYRNNGNWVESLTVLIQHHDGRLEIADWSARQQLSPQLHAVPVEAAAPPYRTAEAVVDLPN